MRFASLDEGFSLWSRYTREASQAVGRLGDRAFELKYEDFLKAPTERITELATFCEVRDVSVATNAVRHVDASRAFAYRDSAELRAFAETRDDELAEFGY